MSWNSLKRLLSQLTLPSQCSIDAEEERLTKLISELEGKSLADLIAEGSAKLASVPSGGGGAAAAPAAGGAAPADAPKEEKKKEEEKEESDDDMGFGLFDCELSRSNALSHIYTDPLSAVEFIEPLVRPWSFHTNLIQILELHCFHPT